MEYHSWNLFHMVHMVWLTEGQKGQVGEATFFILYNKLFVGKTRWMILYWNIVNLISFVAFER